METGSIQNAIIGAFFALAGVLMIVFRKDLQAFDESWRAPLPESLVALRPRGKVLTIFIIVFGALFLLGGITVVLVNLV